MIKHPAYDELKSRVRSGLGLLRHSQFARDASWLVILNGTSKAIGFFGSAYAARSLGPFNLGISSLIQATTQQVALSYNGGFNTVAVRRIASDKEECTSIVGAITLFRLCLGVIASVIWTVFCYAAINKSQRSAWLMGVPLIMFAALRIGYAFQGLEKLPLQTAISTSGALLSTSAYFLFFSPGMFLGADLIVLSVVGLVTLIVAWSAYYHIFRQWPVVKTSWNLLLGLLRESWRYWLLAVVVFFYSVFQIPLIAYLLGSREVGIFRAAFGLAVGVELLFSSINSLLLARLVNWKKMGLGAMWQRQGKILLAFLIIGLPIVGVLIIAAPTIYSLLLGDAFKEGVLVLQILVVGRLVVFLGQIYAWGLVAAGQDNQFLAASVLGAVTSIAMNLLLIPKFGLLGAACVSVVSEILVHTYCFLIAKKSVGKLR